MVKFPNPLNLTFSLRSKHSIIVDNTSSTRVRITAVPDSYDVVPVRNQILQIDLVNTKVTTSVDATATTGVGYVTTQTSSGETTTTVSTPSSSSTSSGY